MTTRPHASRSLAGVLAASLACVLAAWAFDAAAAQKTVCTVTINSPDEKETLQRHLPRDGYRFVELVQRGRPDWLAEACRSGVSCDALVISGHFDDGTEFYTDRVDNREFLTVPELQRASCSAACNGLFSQLKEVYLFGCKTLQTLPRHVAAGEIERSLLRSGRTPAEAERIAGLLNARYGESNRARLQHIFNKVPVLYGFSAQAPLGQVAGPLLERYFQTAPAGEVASGRPSATLLNLFGPSSMVAVAGLADNDPNADFRQDMCRLADEQPTTAQKVAFLHEVLQRDMTQVRMLLDHLERYAVSLGPAQRAQPGVPAALAAIGADRAARARYLDFARDADEAPVQTRMLALARMLGWLTPAEEQAEVLDMIAGRMREGRLGLHEVDLVCAMPAMNDPALAQQLLARGAARPADLAHAAVLACLGSAAHHEQAVRALTAADDQQVAVAQVYLRHRPLSGVGELRTLASGIGRMGTGAAQLRALETLSKQRLDDTPSMQAIAGLFAQARSLQAQRAIAAILIRADYRALEPAELARTLRQHRLKSPDGSDVIDLLIRLLQSA